MLIMSQSMCGIGLIRGDIGLLRIEIISLSLIEQFGESHDALRTK